MTILVCEPKVGLIIITSPSRHHLAQMARQRRAGRRRPWPHWARPPPPPPPVGRTQSHWVEVWGTALALSKSLGLPTPVKINGVFLRANSKRHAEDLVIQYRRFGFRAQHRKYWGWDYWHWNYWDSFRAQQR